MRNSGNLKQPIFMRIEIGSFENMASLRKVLDESGYSISNIAEDILDQIKLSPSRQTVDLVVMSVHELGFTKYAPATQVYEAALEKGLELCSAEIGPQLRLQYTDQPDLPSTDWLHVAMRPIDGFHFTVGHFRGVYYLNARSSGRNDVFESGCRFVFIQNNKD